MSNSAAAHHAERDGDYGSAAGPWPAVEEPHTKDAKYVVRLTGEERAERQSMVDEGRGARTVRQRLVEQGFEAGVYRKPSTNRRYRQLAAVGEARLVAEACSPAPEGRNRWTLRLLADRLVALEVVNSICADTVRLTLGKTNSSPICRTSG